VPHLDSDRIYPMGVRCGTAPENPTKENWPLEARGRENLLTCHARLDGIPNTGSTLGNLTCRASGAVEER